MGWRSEESWWSAGERTLLALLALAKAARAYAVFREHLLVGMLNAITAWAMLVLLVLFWPRRVGQAEGRARFERHARRLRELHERNPLGFDLVAAAVAAGVLALLALRAL